MTRVKICGITNPQDAAMAVEAGADALGFIFVRGTPRYIRPEEAREVIGGLPPLVTAVGVFVDQPLEEVLLAAATCNLGAVQLQGSEPEAFSRRIPVKVIKAFRVRAPHEVDGMAGYPADAYLLDAYVEGRPGGTGTPFPWAWALRAKEHGRIILSGGLTPATVEAAVRQVRPFGVDVSTGVEQRPGTKDPEKVRAFVAAVRRADLG